ncbi:hypothetical protein HID58_032652 [Brassica napus]|uniref:Uncharacterized protein n=1 Tax=Brassica napus TaxID=3708 RepID=A0ABQ8BWY4_BRANA|nr:hypothetical protein HID58_032652 [Brassica napus]
MSQGGMIKRDVDGERSREAILKYAEVAVKDPKFIAPAYSQTQLRPSSLNRMMKKKSDNRF